MHYFPYWLLPLSVRTHIFTGMVITENTNAHSFICWYFFELLNIDIIPIICHYSFCTCLVKGMNKYWNSEYYIFLLYFYCRIILVNIENF